MLQTKKGSALLIAVMVSVILMIVTSGLIFVASQQQRLVATETKNTRLFYAADAGLTHALKRLRVMSQEQLLRGNEDDQNIISNAPAIEINEAKVKLTATCVKQVWTITAVATDNNSTQNCTMKMDNIMCSSLNTNTLTVETDMPEGVALEQQSTSQSDKNNLNPSCKSDWILGDMHFGGTININCKGDGGKSIFDGKITSSSKTASVRKCKDLTTSQNNAHNAEFAIMHQSIYKQGIVDITNVIEVAFNEKSEKTGRNTGMHERYGKIFATDSYKTVPGVVNANTDAIYSFAEVKAKAKNPIVVKVGSTDDLRVKITEGKITVTNNGTAIKDENGVEIKDRNYNKDNNAILFAGATTAENRVAIEESEIAGSLTLMTENVDIELLGDIKYKNYTNAFPDVANMTADKPYLAYQAGLKAADSESMFGCVSEKGNIWLGKELCTSVSDLLGQTILSGSFYAPNGKFGARGEYNEFDSDANILAAGNGAKKFGGIEQWLASSTSGTSVGSSTYPCTRVVVVGSAMMKSWGTLRKYTTKNSASVGNAKTSGYRGLNATFCSDDRITKDGLRPLVFKPLNSSSGFVIDEKAMVWSYQYGSK